MHTFEFIRPADPAAAINTAAQSKTAQQGADVRFLGGGTTLLDLMKLNVETPDPRARYQSPSVRQDRRHVRRRPEDRRDGSQFGSGKSREGVARLCRAVPGDSFRCIGTDSQHGDNRRQPGAENALRLFPRYGDALQQARTGNRLPRHHRQQSHARNSRNQRSLHRHQPVGYVRGDGSAGGSHPRAGTQGDTHHSHSAISTFCPATRQIVRRCLNLATLSRMSRCRRRSQEASRFI